MLQPLGLQLSWHESFSGV